MKSPAVASPSTTASAPRMVSIVVSRDRAELSAVAIVSAPLRCRRVTSESPPCRRPGQYYTCPRVGGVHDVGYNWAASQTVVTRVVVQGGPHAERSRSVRRRSAAHRHRDDRVHNDPGQSE